MADAFAVLRADHEKVLGMLDRLEELTGPTAGAASARTEECSRLVRDLVVDESKHEAVEEQYFWPTVTDRAPDGGALAGHAVAQETEAKQVLDRLDKMDGNHPDWAGLIRSFVEAGRAHIGYEENEVWPKLRAVLSADEAEERGGKLAAGKEKAPTRPHPHTPPNPTVLKTAGPAVAAADRVRDAVTGRNRDTD